MSAKLIESFKVLSTLAAYRAVAINTSGAGVVAYPSAAGAAQPVGVTTDTVKDITEAIPVQLDGRAKLLFNDTVAAGALVAVDSSGRGVPHTDVTAGSYVIGRALEAVTATGTIADILINPIFKSIP
jgi:hypothetical protein